MSRRRCHPPRASCSRSRSPTRHGWRKAAPITCISTPPGSAGSLAARSSSPGVSWRQRASAGRGSGWASRAAGSARASPAACTMASPSSSPRAMRRTLAPAPVALLDLPPEMAARLDRWGIRTLGELAALPSAALFERLGGEGPRLQQLARGEDPRPLRPWAPPPILEETAALDDAVEALGPLVELLATLAGRISDQLARRGRSADQFEWVCHLADRRRHEGSCVPAVPLSERAAVTALLRASLEAHPPARRGGGGDAPGAAGAGPRRADVPGRSLAPEPAARHGDARPARRPGRRAADRRPRAARQPSPRRGRARALSCPDAFVDEHSGPGRGSARRSPCAASARRFPPASRWSPAARSSSARGGSPRGSSSARGRGACRESGGPSAPGFTTNGTWSWARA